MSLTFPNTSTSDSVSIAHAASINNLLKGTICCWINPTTVNTTNERILDKNGTQRFLFVVHDSANGDLRFGLNRSVVSLNIRVASFVDTSGWQFVAATWDTTLTNTDQHLYRGTLISPVAEAGSYATQVVGSGTHDDSGANLFVGGTGTANTFAGAIAWVGLWNVQLSLAQLQVQQYSRCVTSGNALFMELGLGSIGVGTQQDWSGNGNNGTVTGTVQSDHVPTEWARINRGQAMLIGGGLVAGMG